VKEEGEEEGEGEGKARKESMPRTKYHQKQGGLTKVTM
jgi:hypothetical protein